MSSFKFVAYECPPKRLQCLDQNLDSRATKRSKTRIPKVSDLKDLRIENEYREISALESIGYNNLLTKANSILTNYLGILNVRNIYK
jgi:hypothetical protein